MSADGPDPNVLKIEPPMIFTKDNAKELILNLRNIMVGVFMLLSF
jgi:4-aminobutyrate aminotransferase-like enzyme